MVITHIIDWLEVHLTILIALNFMGYILWIIKINIWFDCESMLLYYGYVVSLLLNL